MKKTITHLLLVAALALPGMAAASTSYTMRGVEFKADTLFHAQIGPGTTQTSLFLPVRNAGLHRVHRPADTEAETGAFRNAYAHSGTFSPMIRFSSARTSCTFISEVSSFTESLAIFSGAMAR